MKVSKVIFAACIFAAVLFSGCKTKVDPGFGDDTGNGTGGGNNTNKPSGDETNPSLSILRSANLDFIFNTDSVGKITITMKRSEWNQMLKNYDYFYKNENCVKFTRFEYEKDGKKWDLTKGGGIRLRGNTSRYRPQGKDSPDDKTGHMQMNADWMQGYYSYAKDCPDDDYRQSHFKVDFEEFLEDGDEQKLAGCMKGVALKRMDSSCTKEIFCYDLFHRFGIWTAPRASHTRVFFKFIEDDNTVTTVNYGVYEMFEEVNKQSLKARDKDENKASNAWKNSKGNLWKCGGGDLTNPNATMYAEKVEITEFDSEGNPKSYVWDSPTYDLKTNKDSVDEAAAEFRQFITELNNLPNVSDNNDTININAIKAFYEKWMDVEFFLKSYAITVLVGMDDDYWGNANNYYLYFADSKDGSRKVYFIPFDYDNTLGASIKGEHAKGEKEGIEQNPLDWGRGAKRPLMDKILQVPEYRQLYKDLLKEVSSPNGEWNYEKCSQRWYKYWDMVDPYLDSPDLSNEICIKGHGDNVYKPSGYSLINQANNLYDYTRSCFMSYIREPGEKMKFDLNGGNIDGNTASVEIEFPDYITTLARLIKSPKRDGYIFTGWTKTKNGEDYQSDPYESVIYARWKKISEIKDLFIYELEPGMEGYREDYEGIQIRVLNPPSIYDEKTNRSGARVRQIYVNGVKVTDVSNSSEVVATTWGFPYTEAGKKYTVQIKYLKEDYWNVHSMTNEVSIEAKSGLGKFSLETNTVHFNVADNVISFSPNDPEIYVAGKRISTTDNPGYYQITFHDSEWSYSIYPGIGNYSVEPFNVLEEFSKNYSWALDKALASPIQTEMRYIVHNDDGFGDYRLEINVSGSNFNLVLNELPEVIPVQGTSEQPGFYLRLPGDELPENVYIRRIWLNGELVSDIRSYSPSERNLVFANEWFYPLVIPGKKYDFSVEYLNEGWHTLYVKEGSITPQYGIGEIGVETMPVYEVKDNKITWTTQPVMKIINMEGEDILTEEMFLGLCYYNMNLTTTSWKWCTWENESSYTLSDFNVLERCKDMNPENLNLALSNKCFMTLTLKIGSNYSLEKSPYGEYVYEILNDSSKMNFSLKE